MTTITHFLNNDYTQNLIKAFEDKVREYSNHTLQDNISNYSDIIEETAYLVSKLALEAISFYFKMIDDNFRNSETRKRSYYIKDYRDRTIITPFGELTFTRTIYELKKANHHGKKTCFTFLDRHLGLPRYDRYDPTVKAMIFEQFSTQNSMTKVGRIIGDRIYSSFTKKETRKYFEIPRQTIQNIVSKANIYKPPLEEVNYSVDTIYIMADEKFIATQGNGKNKVMVKSCVIFDGLRNTASKGTQYTGKYSYSNYTSTEDFWMEVFDIVSQRYDLETNPKIYIMGDGASWIKSGTQYFKNASFALDRFHFSQAINHITKESDYKKLIYSYILNNQKKEFKKIINFLTRKIDPGREEIIKEKSKYLLNHWKAIHIMYKEVIIGCGMEGAISHNIASIFANIPKGYNEDNLETYLNIRHLYLNDYDLREVYLNIYYKEEKVVTDLKPLNYSIFEPRETEDGISSIRYIKGFFN